MINNKLLVWVWRLVLDTKRIGASPSHLLVRGIAKRPYSPNGNPHLLRCEYSHLTQAVLVVNLAIFELKPVRVNTLSQYVFTFPLSFLRHGSFRFYEFNNIVITYGAYCFSLSTNSISLSTNSFGKPMSRSGLKCLSSLTI